MISFFLNTLIYITVFLFFSISVYGYGKIFNNYIFKNNEINIGETGIIGFLNIYFIVLVLNFFTPIDIKISLPLLFLGFLTGFFFIKVQKEYKIKIILLIIVTTILLGITNNHHDDVYWYHLPHINYLQNFKIIFGITNINHFIYGQAFYDVMSFFKIPYYKNNFIYCLPIIFLMFFLISLYENYNSNKNNKNLLFLIYFFLIVILVRYTRSKEYGVDLPAQLLMALFFINTFMYNKKKKEIYFFKSILFLIFGILVKIYVVFIIPFILIYISNFKQILNSLLKKKSFIIYFILLILLSFSKNFINTGCIIYPINKLCFQKTVVTWSPGVNFINKVENHLKANSKGYNTYTKNITNENLLSQTEFIKKYNYTFLKFRIKDKDVERLSIIIIIFVILLVINRSKEKEKNNLKQDKYLIFFSILSIILWGYLGGFQARYGGNFLLAIFLFSIAISFNLINKPLIKKGNIYLLIFCLLFLIQKNINRIKIEYNNLEKIEKKSYPINDFKNVYYQTNNKFIENINITDHPIYCFNIPMLCATKTTFNSISDIEIINGYLIIKSNESKKIISINIEQKYITNKFYKK